MRTILYVSGGLAALILSGCSSSPAGMAMSVAKGGFKVIQGAEAQVIPLKRLAAGSAKDYDSLVLGEVTTDLPAICTGDVVDAARKALEEVLSSDRTTRAFPGEGQALRINVVCRFFKQKSLIGKESRLDQLVTLVDADTGEERGQLYIEGLSESLRAYGRSDLAEANAKELIDYLSDRKRGKEGG